MCESVCVREIIQKHSRGLNRVPARTYIFACLHQLSYRCHNLEIELPERGLDVPAAVLLVYELVGLVDELGQETLPTPDIG